MLWTIGFDTIYAVQDIEDDALAGIGSTARAFGGRVRLGSGVFMHLRSSALQQRSLPLGRTMGASGLGLFALHLAWQVTQIDPNNGTLALRLFRSNRDAGLILFAVSRPKIFLTQR